MSAGQPGPALPWANVVGSEIQVNLVNSRARELWALLRITRNDHFKQLRHRIPFRVHWLYGLCTGYDSPGAPVIHEIGRMLTEITSGTFPPSYFRVRQVFAYSHRHCSGSQRSENSSLVSITV